MGIIAALLFLSAPLFSQAKLSFEGEGKPLNFGDVYAGNKLTHEVVITNKGRDTLHITNVRAQCGCTATLLKENTIAPGDSTHMTVTFDSKNYPPQKVVKHVYVTSNDTATGGIRTLEFVATIYSALTLDPVFFSFNQARVDSEYRKTLKIVNTSKAPITIESIKLRDKVDFLKLSLGKKHLDPGESTELAAVLLASKAGSFQGIIDMKTNNPDQKNVEIRYLAWVNR